MITVRAITTDLAMFIRGQALGGRPLAVDADLLDGRILDSLLLMDLVAYIESTYEIQLDDSDLSPRNFRTIEDMANLVAARLRTAHAPAGVATSVDDADLMD